MEIEEKNIELYPSHWLYNAGVLGFLKVLNNCSIDINQLFKRDGTLRGNIENAFEETVLYKDFHIPLVVWKWLMQSGNNLKRDFEEKAEDPIKDIWGTLFNVIYRGFYNANSNLLYHSKTSPAILKLFLNSFNSFLKYVDENPTCSFCLKKGTQSYKNRFSSEHYKELGGSDGTSGMPNSFWNNNKKTGTNICDTCSFLLLCRHLAFTKLIDYTSVFVNAPSFLVMFELNKILSTFTDKKNSNYRSLLAMSVVEFSIKTNVMLHSWARMEIEIVAIDRTGKIECISLPYDTIKILSNKRIASLLSSIGEFSVLNMVINNKWKDLVELAYRLLKIAMKKSIGKEDRNLINSFFYAKDGLQTSASIRLTANKLMKLYSLIEERTKNNKYEYING